MICKKPQNSRVHEAGYNLLMTSIALIVIGIIGVGFLQIYSLYKKNDLVTTNQARVTDAITVIQNFKNVNGRFPCPSSINANRVTDPTYGAEDCATVIPAGTCTNGICVVNGRTIAGVAQPVRIGTIPFRLLQIDEKETYDAYGSRLLYAVTQNQTNITTFNEINGAIDIVDESGQSVADPNGTAATRGNVSIAIVSNGEDKFGAFNLAGTQPIACTAGNSESANCLNLTLPPAAPYRLVSSMEYLIGGATQFDDTIEYFSSTTPSRWRRTTANADNIQTISNTNVGIEVNTPAVALDISHSLVRPAGLGIQGTFEGALMVSGSINADEICDNGGVNCFKTSNFAQTPNPLMDCNSSSTRKYMIGIGGDGTGKNAHALCDYVRTSCPAGQVITGFNNATGLPKCTGVGTSCPVSTVQICNGAVPNNFLLRNSNETQTRPTNTKCIGSVGCNDAGIGVDGQTYRIFDPTSYNANFAYADFKCTAGIWVKTGNLGGMCSCNPTVPANSNCTTSPLSANCTATASCAGAGTGTASTPYTYSAASCGWVAGITSYAACTCPTTPRTASPGTQSCSTGSNTTNWYWNSSQAVCAWNYTCACTPPNSRSRTLTTGVACSTPAPNGPGLAGHTGLAYRTQNFNSASGVCGWEDSGWDTSACSCDTSAPPFSEITTSTCNVSCEKESTPAYNWYKYTLDTSGACVKTFDHATNSVCVNKVFSWKINAAYAPTTGRTSHGSIAIGDACNSRCTTNNIVGNPSACWQSGVGNTYDIYNCTCQEN